MLTDIHSRQLIELPDDITPGAVQKYRKSVLAMLAQEPDMVVLDCSTVRSLTSTHVGLMWEIFVDCRRLDIKLKLANVSEQSRHVLRTLDLESVFFAGEETSSNMEVTVRELVATVPTSEYHDSIRLTRGDIEAANSRFLTFLDGIGIRSITAFELRLIVYEVLMNIKLHSGLKSKDLVEFAVQLDRTGATLTFEDRGDPFDPSVIDNSDIVQQAAPSGRVRGFGLAMIHKMVRDVCYTREDNLVNKLVLRKMWS